MLPLDSVVVTGIDNDYVLSARNYCCQFWRAENKELLSSYLKKIFADGIVDEDSVIRKFRITAANGKNL